MSVKLRERKEFGNSPITSDNEEESLMGKLLGQMSTVQGGSMLNLLDNGHQEVIDLTIHQAAREGALQTIKKEFQDRDLDAKININQQNREQQTPLHLAAIFNHEAVIRYLVEQGAWIDAEGEHKDTPLHLAIKHDATIAAKTLIQLGASVAARTSHGSTPLHFAANRGNKEICRLLLSFKEVDANVSDYGKTTPLHMSVYSGKISIAQLLLSQGAKAGAKDVEGKMAIHVAASEGNSEFIKILLKAMEGEAKQSKTKNDQINLINAQTIDGKSPLHLAVQFGHTSTVDVLLNLGADIHCRCNSNIGVLHFAAIGGHIALIKLLIKNKCRVNGRDDYLMTPLHKACLYGQMDAIKLLSALGANLEVRNTDYYTPLLCAVWNGQVETVKHLISVGANVKATDISQKTVLHIAVQRKHLDILKLLLEYEEAVELINTPEKRQWTPLHFAAGFGVVKFISTLIKHGGEVNLTTNLRKTPLHLAAESGKVKAVSLLCKLAPCSINKTDDFAKTPLVWAVISGHLQVCEKLLSVGADVMLCDDTMMSPLHYAATEGYSKIVQLLLENHAKVDAVNFNFETPLHHASRNGNVDCIKVLLERGANIEIKDKSGKFCFDLAVENYKKNACLELLRHKRWRVLMRNIDFAGERPMQKLIEREPEVAEAVLDNCIDYSKDSKEHREFSIKYNFEYINVQPTQDQKGFFGPSCMAKFNREDLLSHPVTINLINDKWKLFGRQLYFLLLLIYCAFVGLLTYLAMDERNTIDKAMKNGTVNICLHNSIAHKHILPSILMVYIVIQLIKELIQMIMHGPSYFMEIENYIELCLYITAFNFGWMFIADHNNCHKDYIVQHQSSRKEFGSIAILLAYCNLLLHLKRFPFCGLVVVMFTEVLRTVISVLIVFSIVIIGFGFSFYFLIGGTGNDGQGYFKTITDSILQVVSMTIGDGTINPAQRARGGGNSSSNKNMYVALYLVFTLLLPIVMINLMVGLAVGEIAEVTKSAKLRMLKAQVDVVTRFERRFPKRFISRFFRQHVTLYPNQRNFYEKFMDWLGTYTFDSLASSIQIENAIQYQDNKAHQMNSVDLEYNFERNKNRIKKLFVMCEEQRNMMQQILEYIARQQIPDDEGISQASPPMLVVEDPDGQIL